MQAKTRALEDEGDDRPANTPTPYPWKDRETVKIVHTIEPQGGQLLTKFKLGKFTYSQLTDGFKPQAKARVPRANRKVEVIWRCGRKICQKCTATIDGDTDLKEVVARSHGAAFAQSFRNAYPTARTTGQASVAGAYANPYPMGTAPAHNAGFHQGYANPYPPAPPAASSFHGHGYGYPTPSPVLSHGYPTPTSHHPSAGSSLASAVQPYLKGFFIPAIYSDVEKVEQDAGDAMEEIKTQEEIETQEESGASSGAAWLDSRSYAGEEGDARVDHERFVGLFVRQPTVTEHYNTLRQMQEDQMRDNLLSAFEAVGPWEVTEKEDDA